MALEKVPLANLRSRECVARFDDRVRANVDTAKVSLRNLPDWAEEGPPSSIAGLTRGDRHPFSVTLERYLRYWLRLSGLNPVVEVAALRFAADDLLLFKRARDHLDRFELVYRRIFAVGLAHDSRATDDLPPRKGSTDRGENLDAPSTAATDTSPISEAQASQAAETPASTTSPSEQVVGLVVALERPNVFG